jgi:hypothetical protein
MLCGTTGLALIAPQGLCERPPPRINDPHPDHLEGLATTD